jgi:hypothetical protein
LRSPLNAIENLVVADRRINNDKRDHLADAEHVARWRRRNDRLATDLATVASAHRWDSAPVQTVGVARALYFALGAINLLWAGPGRFVPTDLPRLRSVLA